MCLPLARFFWGHSEICFIYNLKKHCEAKILLAIWDTFVLYMKKIVTIIPINLITKLPLYLFCHFVEIKHKNQTLQVDWLVIKNILFIVSHPLFQRDANSIDFQKEILLHVIHVRIIILWLYQLVQFIFVEIIPIQNFTPWPNMFKLFYIMKCHHSIYAYQAGNK